MQLVLLLIIGTLSTAALVCLSVYLYLAHRGRSTLLYSTTDVRRMSVQGKIFHALAAIALLICAYRGAETMTFWIPSSWGTLDNEGNFTTLRTGIAVTFSLIAGVALVILLDRSNHRDFDIEDLIVECRELKRILNAAGSNEVLQMLADEYEDCAKTLFIDAGSMQPQRTISEPYRDPGAKTGYLYRKLAAMTRHQIQRQSRGDA